MLYITFTTLLCILTTSSHVVSLVGNEQNMESMATRE